MSACGNDMPRVINAAWWST